LFIKKKDLKYFKNGKGYLVEAFMTCWVGGYRAASSLLCLLVINPPKTFGQNFGIDIVLKIIKTQTTPVRMTKSKALEEDSRNNKTHCICADCQKDASSISKELLRISN